MVRLLITIHHLHLMYNICKISIWINEIQAWALWRDNFQGVDLSEYVYSSFFLYVY